MRTRRSTRRNARSGGGPGRRPSAISFGASVQSLAIPIVRRRPCRGGLQPLGWIRAGGPARPCNAGPPAPNLSGFMAAQDGGSTLELRLASSATRSVTLRWGEPRRRGAAGRTASGPNPAANLVGILEAQTETSRASRGPSASTGGRLARASPRVASDDANDAGETAARIAPDRQVWSAGPRRARRRPATIDRHR